MQLLTCARLRQGLQRKGTIPRGVNSAVSISVERHQEVTALEQVHRANLEQQVHKMSNVLNASLAKNTRQYIE